MEASNEFRRRRAHAARHFCCQRAGCYRISLRRRRDDGKIIPTEPGIWGMSVYTFHAISYVVDIFRGKVEPETSFVNVALYISFFPQLIAGPIIRATFIMPQIRRRRPYTRSQQVIGIRLLLLGFVYKAVIADMLAEVADPVFAHLDQYNAHALLTATVAFYGQIYFDFAGYSYMAIGTARLFGYRFPRNFNYPYRSASMTEFWRRWHMSLSFWLRDYLIHTPRRQSWRLP